MGLLQNFPSLRVGRKLLDIASTAFDELAQLHLDTCARFTHHKTDTLSRIFQAGGFNRFVDQQRRQYLALSSDREDYLGSVSKIVRRTVRHISDLRTKASDPGTAPSEIVGSPHGAAAATRTNVSTADAKFELFQDQTGDHRFRLIAEAGTELLTSEGYRSKKGARNGVEVVRRNAGNDSRYARIQTDSGLPMFNLIGGNHQVVATSLPYQSSSAMEHALAMVKAASATAEVVVR
jgi:uncharacterized protein YegP (UPF0339 family)